METLTLGICIIGNNIVLCRSLTLNATAAMCSYTTEGRPLSLWPAHAVSRLLSPAPPLQAEAVRASNRTTAMCGLLLLLSLFLGAKIDSIGFVVIRSKVNVNVVAGKN